MAIGPECGHPRPPQRATPPELGNSRYAVDYRALLWRRTSALGFPRPPTFTIARDVWLLRVEPRSPSAAVSQSEFRKRAQTAIFRPYESRIVSLAISVSMASRVLCRGLGAAVNSDGRGVNCENLHLQNRRFARSPAGCTSAIRQCDPACRCLHPWRCADDGGSNDDAQTRLAIAGTARCGVRRRPE